MEYLINFFSTKTAIAAGTTPRVDVGVTIPGFSQTSYSYGSYVSAVIKWGIGIGISLCTLMIIYAGIKYMTSQGNQTQIADAKDIMVSTITGFIMLILIWLILKVLGIK